MPESIEKLDWVLLEERGREVDLVDRLSTLKSKLESQDGDNSVWFFRADLDIKEGSDGQVNDWTRIEATLPAVRRLLDHGERVVLSGHIGRRPDESLEHVARSYASALGQPVPLVTDWIDPTSGEPSAGIFDALGNSGSSSIIMLENTRRYQFERSLWETEGRSEAHKRNLLEIAANFSTLFDYFVNDAIAANNPDFSTCVLPLAFDEVHLGDHFSSELIPLRSAAAADIVVMSGIKINKLDALEFLVKRTPAPRLILVGGALSLAMIAAKNLKRGEDPGIGRAGWDPQAPGYVPEARISQAEIIVSSASDAGIELLTPIDYILNDGTVAGEIPGDALHGDAGPGTTELFSDAIFDEARRIRGGAIVINGVLGKFEEAAFSSGTEALLSHIAEISATTGLRVFVGGGEGALAVRRFGLEHMCDHVFTAGGTTLRAVAGQSIPPLRALLAASEDLWSES